MMRIRLDEKDPPSVKALVGYESVLAYHKLMVDPPNVYKMQVATPTEPVEDDLKYMFCTSSKDVFCVLGQMTEPQKWCLAILIENALAEEDEVVFYKDSGRSWFVTRMLSKPTRTVSFHFSTSGR